MADSLKATGYNCIDTVKFPWKGFLIFLAIFIASIFYLGRVYAVLSVAFILSYLLEPIVGYLTKKKLDRTLASILVLILFFTFITLASVLIFPKIFTQGRELFLKLPTAYQNLVDWLGPLSEKYIGYNIFMNFNQALENIGKPTELVSPIGGVVGRLFSTTFKFITSFLSLLIIPLLSFYLLREFPHLYRKTVKKMLHVRYHALSEEIKKRLNTVLGGFIRGQLVVSAILSAYYITALTIIGLDLSLVLGLLAGFLNVIPYIGISIALISSLLIALVHGFTTGGFISIIVVYAIGMVAEGAVITPKVLGNKVGLSPLALIVALLIGGELFGIVGMVIAIPVAAVVKVFTELFLEHRI